MIFVLEHVKHVYDKALGRPVDVHRWHSAHPTFEDAIQTGEQFAKDAGLVGRDPVYVWWEMEPEPWRKWWMSNEFGPNKKNVGNTLRILKVAS
jgi:hypothetical protein